MPEDGPTRSEGPDVDTRLDNLLTSNLGIDSEALHRVGQWRLFNHLRMGWGIIAGGGGKEEVVIRRFKRLLRQQDIEEMKAVHREPSVGESEALPEETGRPFIGLIEQDPKRDIIVEGTLGAKELRLGMAIASLPDDRLALIKLDKDRPLIITPNNLGLRQEGRIDIP